VAVAVVARCGGCYAAAAARCDVRAWRLGAMKHLSETFGMAVSTKGKAPAHICHLYSSVDR
jgi:hypothetical protein